MANEATTLHNLFLTIFDRNQNKQTTLSLSTLINYQDNSIIRLDPSPPTDNDATTAEGQTKRNKVESSTTDTDTNIEGQNRRNKAQLVLWCKPAFLAEKEDKTNRAIRRKKDIIDVIATYTRREMRTALLNESRKPHIQCSNLFLPADQIYIQDIELEKTDATNFTTTAKERADLFTTMQWQSPAEFAVAKLQADMLTNASVAQYIADLQTEFKRVDEPIAARMALNDEITFYATLEDSDLL